MNDKFKNVPVEWDTKILFSEALKIENIDALYQIWNWDGIDGSSLIFVSEEVAQLSDPALENLVKNLSFFKKDSSVTIKRKPTDYTFVNFNFQVKD